MEKSEHIEPYLRLNAIRKVKGVVNFEHERIGNQFLISISLDVAHCSLKSVVDDSDIISVDKRLYFG